MSQGRGHVFSKKIIHFGWWPRPLYLESWVLHLYSISYGKWDFYEQNIYLDIMWSGAKTFGYVVARSQFLKLTWSESIPSRLCQGLVANGPGKCWTGWHHQVVDWKTWDDEDWALVWLNILVGYLAADFGEMLSFVLLCFHSKGIWLRNRVYLSKEIKYVLILIFHLIYILSYI